MPKQVKCKKDPKLKEESSMIRDESVEAARKVIYNELVKKYKFTKKNALDTELSISLATQTAMIKLYNDSYLESDRSGKFKPFECVNDAIGKDVTSFAWNALSIPFYQSLGDTMGYFNGRREFNAGDINANPEYTNDLIYEFIALGGINDSSIKHWLASDSK